MPTKRLPGPRRLPGPVTTPRTYRATPVLGAAIRRAAAGEGLTEGAWVRATLAAAAGAEPFPADLQPVRAYRPSRPPPSVDIVAVAGLREAVGEAVGTLRQVAGLDRARCGARLGEIDDALDGLLAAVAVLDEAKHQLIRKSFP